MTPAADSDLRARIRARASRAGADVDETLARRLAAYLEILARWNRKINLTSLDVDPPSDEAIDRLVIESVVAATFVNADEHVVLDVGSGGGSPALPLKLALPRLRFILVESKVRKAAFLREAVRHLELDGVEVENRRVEDLGGMASRVDLVTLRAVRVDESLEAAIRGVLRSAGRIFLFGSAPVSEKSISLVAERLSSLTIGMV